MEKNTETKQSENTEKVFAGEFGFRQPDTVDTFIPKMGRLLILPDPKIEKTASGIIIPETAQERPQSGTIIKLSDDIEWYNVGDRVLYGKEAGIPIDFVKSSNQRTGLASHIRYYLMHPSEIFGKI